jgi:hypothetical protein
MNLPRLVADIQLQPRSVKPYRDIAELLRKQGKTHEANAFEELAEHVNNTRRHQEQHQEYPTNSRLGEASPLSCQNN